MTLWQTISAIKPHVFVPPTDFLRANSDVFSCGHVVPSFVVGAGDQRVSMAPDVAEQLIKDGYGVPRSGEGDFAPKTRCLHLPSKRVTSEGIMCCNLLYESKKQVFTSPTM